MNSYKKVPVIAAIVFFGIFIAGCWYSWPEELEPVTVSFDERWKVGADVAVESEVYGMIPAITFEYNGGPYTTTSDKEVLPANLIFTTVDKIMTASETSQRYQAFYVARTGTDLMVGARNVCAMYVVVEDNNVYYAREIIYSKKYYSFSLKEKEAEVTINHRPDFFSLLSAWLIASLIGGFVALFLSAGDVSYKEEKRKKENKEV